MKPNLNFWDPCAALRSEACWISSCLLFPVENQYQRGGEYRDWVPGVQDHDMGGIFGQERSMVLFDGCRDIRARQLTFSNLLIYLFCKTFTFLHTFPNVPTLSAQYLSNVRRLHADVSSPQFLLICKFGPTTQYLHVVDKLANQISLLMLCFLIF